MGSEDQDLTVHSKKRIRAFIIPKVSILTKNITLEDLTKIYLNSYLLLVMREDTMPDIVVEIRVTLTRRRTKEKIMFTQQRMMILQKRVKQESEDSSSDEECVLISSLMGTFTHGSND